MLLPLGGALEAEKPAEEDPRRSGIVETTTARLAQLDVTVSGPKDVIESLNKGDFELKVDHRRVTDFLVDRLCEPGPAVAAFDAPAAPAETRAAPRATSYL